MNEPNEPGQNATPTDELDARTLKRLSRRSFLWGGLAVGGGLTALTLFDRYAPAEKSADDPDSPTIKTVFRKTHQFNEGVARRLFYSESHSAPEFAPQKAVEPRNNYRGNTPEIDLDSWRLTVEGVDGGKSATLTLANLAAFPEVRQVSELKCVEGWSAVVDWSGFRFVDFAKKYPPPANARYVEMRSEPEGFEDDWYYVGLDLESCLHPQTLLATKRAQQPLNAEHGAPLRLVMPHKYGIKNIKLITKIAYRTDRPKDYWADRGYDWYAGL